MTDYAHRTYEGMEADASVQSPYLPAACSYLTDDGVSRCNRPGPLVDYFRHDHVTGSTLIASLCTRHNRSAAQTYAVQNGMEYREREEVAA